MSTGFDRSRCLEELEHDAWGETQYDSYLLSTCHRLRRVPLSEFTTEDLRIMIGQGIGLRYLVPLAIEQLEQNPLCEGDFYPGDLLNAVLHVPESLWSESPDLCLRVREIVAHTRKLLDSLDEADVDVVRESVATAPRVLTR